LIADREGNIIARLPHPEEFVGQNMRRSHERIMDGDESGWKEVTEVDGITRIFGYVPSSLPPRDFFLSVGEAKAGSFTATLILAGLLASICVAWAGQKLVLRPTRGLRWPVAEQPLANSEPDARVAIHQQSVAGSDEVRQLLRTSLTGEHVATS
jgi:hypothetical protein